MVVSSSAILDPWVSRTVVRLSLFISVVRCSECCF